jgi:hypothetical protein
LGECGNTGAYRAFSADILSLPEMMVLKPTSTPLTSVIALNFPVVPSKGIPISLALVFERVQINEQIKANQ